MSVSAKRGESGAAGSPRRLRSVAGEVLESLYQHRLLSTTQLREIHAPHASARWTQRVLAELEAEGLARFARVARGALRAWYLTEAGADLVESIPNRVEDRRKLLDLRHPSGALQAHTLAVNELGLCFLRAARKRDDEFSSRSWRHEVAHPIGPAPGMRRGELLIADAVFAYMVVRGEDLALEYRFCELDRCTLPSERLARKLARYARLYRFRPRPARQDGQAPQPAWRAHYLAFPIVLVCFADRPAAELRRRRRLVAALCRTEPELQATSEVRFSFCLLDDLRERGPFAPVFIEPERPDEPVDWLGQGGGVAQGATEAAEEK